MYHFAPKYWFPETGTMLVELEGLKEDHNHLEEAYEGLEHEHQTLLTKYKKVSQEKAEAETRLSLSENAKGQSATRVQELESEVIKLERQVAFYEKLVTPETEEEVLQCFNISIKKKENKLTYGINFLKHDQKDQSRLETDVKLKVLYGENITNLQEETLSEKESSRDMWLTQSRRLRGSLQTSVPEQGLHILDIKAYSKEDGKIIAHCWKAF